MIGTIMVGNVTVSKGLPVTKTAGDKLVSIQFPTELSEDALWELGRFASMLVGKDYKVGVGD